MPAKRAVLGEITNDIADARGTAAAKRGIQKAKAKAVSFLPKAKDKVKVSDTKKPAQDTSSSSVSSVASSVSTRPLPKLPTHLRTRKSYEKAVVQEPLERADSYVSNESSNDKENRIPPNVVDFDALNADDPYSVSVYVKDIFAYYKSREPLFRVADYMATGIQNEVTTSMRAILVDWLVEVQESFELNHETLYTAVKLLDIYLSRVRVKQSELQLVGATACLIASKIDERIPPMLDDFVYVCDDAYKKEDLIRTEIKMIGVANFDFGYPLTYRFLRRYGRVCTVTMPLLTFSRYILELSLMEYHFVETSESKLAAAALILALKIKEVEGWRDTLEWYSQYSVAECAEIVKELHQMLLKPISSSRKTIRTKYSHSVFHCVALTHIPETLDYC